MFHLKIPIAMVQITLRSIDTRSVQSLIQEVRRLPRITNEKARQLAVLAQKGSDKARTLLINSSMWYVINAALRYKNSCPNAALEDLVQDGSIGLIETVDKYNPLMQTGFLTYANVRIRESIISGLQENGHMIRLPHNSHTLQREIVRFENSFIQKNGFAPTIEDIEEYTGATRAHIYAVTHTHVDSYDSEDYNGGADYVAAELRDPEEEQYNKEKILVLLSKLSQRERYIITKLFGLDGEEMEMIDIAEELGITRERVRQIREKAITIMQHALAA